MKKRKMIYSFLQTGSSPMSNINFSRSDLIILANKKLTLEFENLVKINKNKV